MAYPTELTSQIKAGDSVVKFVQIKGGWIALTEERVIYHAKVYYRDEKKKSIEDSNFPISKITNIRTLKVKTGCIGKTNVLEINMQGQVYQIIIGKSVDQVKPLIQEFVART